jgi:hypothetical protein
MTRSDHQPLLLPGGYKKSTEETTQDTETGGKIVSKEHWSGRVDVNVRPKGIGLRLTQMGNEPLSPQHAKAIGDWEKAAREVEAAKRAGDQHWLEKAQWRFEKARDRLQEIQ